MTRQVHPDKMVEMAADLFSDHGYGLTHIIFVNSEGLNGVCVPKYEYNTETIHSYVYGEGVRVVQGNVKGGRVDE